MITGGRVQASPRVPDQIMRPGGGKVAVQAESAEQSTRVGQRIPLDQRADHERGGDGGDPDIGSAGDALLAERDSLAELAAVQCQQRNQPGGGRDRRL